MVGNACGERESTVHCSGEGKERERARSTAVGTALRWELEAAAHSASTVSGYSLLTSCVPGRHSGVWVEVYSNSPGPRTSGSFEKEDIKGD